MLNGYGGIKEFFGGDFVEVVDALARRYNKLPSEVLREISVSDFNLNVAVMVAAMKAESLRNPTKPSEKEQLQPQHHGFKMTKRPRTATPKRPLMSTPRFRR